MIVEGSEVEPAVLTGEVVADLPDWPVVGVVMTNCDYSFCEDVATRLRDGGAVGEHSAWNFHGLVWFRDGLWCERVSVHRKVAASYQAEDLKTLMITVNGRHGWR